MPKSRSKYRKPIRKGNLAEALTNAPIDKHRTILGEALYPLIKKLEPAAAAKVTGMLLELDRHEVLQLLGSPSALKSVVAVAMAVLRTVPPSPWGANIAGGMGKSGSFTSNRPISLETLGSVLPNLAPDKLKPVLGEFLYPLVEKLAPQAARKVTGMLLELDNTEILHLIQSPEALKSRVVEAMVVLRSFAQQKQQQPVADELGFIEFN